MNFYSGRASAYEVDAAGNRTRADHFDGYTTQTIQYAYNVWNQRTSSSTRAGTTTYAYDLKGNRTTETLGANLRAMDYNSWTVGTGYGTDSQANPETTQTGPNPASEVDTAPGDML